jgi:carbamoylphosphate synthase small subunit
MVEAGRNTGRESHGIMLSNGPGILRTAKLIETIKILIGKSLYVEFAWDICFRHGLTMPIHGKLLRAQRCNHPGKDLKKVLTYITSQIMLHNMKNVWITKR